MNINEPSNKGCCCENNKHISAIQGSIVHDSGTDMSRNDDGWFTFHL
jgi:hypothetical protein